MDRTLPIYDPVAPRDGDWVCVSAIQGRRATLKQMPCDSRAEHAPVKDVVQTGKFSPKVLLCEQRQTPVPSCTAEDESIGADIARSTYRSRVAGLAAFVWLATGIRHREGRVDPRDRPPSGRCHSAYLASLVVWGDRREIRKRRLEEMEVRGQEAAYASQ